MTGRVIPARLAFLTFPLAAFASCKADPPAPSPRPAPVAVTSATITPVASPSCDGLLTAADVTMFAGRAPEAELDLKSVVPTICQSGFHIDERTSIMVTVSAHETAASALHTVQAYPGSARQRFVDVRGATMMRFEHWSLERRNCVVVAAKWLRSFELTSVQDDVCDFGRLERLAIDVARRL